jgi:hypothetical protein
MNTPHGRTPAAKFVGSLKRIILLSTTLLLSGHVAVSQDEPVSRFEVIVQGKTMVVDEGDTIQVNGVPTIIRATKVKTFRLEGLEFEYPRDFAYTFSSENAYRTWSLDGNNVVIMLFEFPAKVDLNVLAKEIVKKFGKKNCKIQDQKLKMDHLELKGKRIKVDMLGAQLTYDLYPLTLDSQKMHVLTFQDTKLDNGSDSEEGVRTMELPSRSLAIK